MGVVAITRGAPAGGASLRAGEGLLAGTNAGDKSIRKSKAYLPSERTPRESTVGADARQ